MRRMWPRIRASINSKGRHHAYETRREERLRQEAIARNQETSRSLLQARERSNHLAERVRMLEEEISEARLDSERRTLAQLG